MVTIIPPLAGGRNPAGGFLLHFSPAWGIVEKAAPGGPGKGVLSPQRNGGTNMLFLVLATLSSSVLALVLKRLNSGNTYGVYFFNYVTCALLSFLTLEDKALWRGDPRPLWLGAVGGLVYLASLAVYGYSIRKSGAVLASVFTRLGVLVPIGVSVAFLGERPSWLQGAGIALAVAAAVVMNGLPRGRASRPGGKLLLPLLLTLLFNGCSDSMSKIFAYAGRREEDGLFVFFIFFFAGLFTLVLLLRQRKGLALRDVLLGALVGVPNFCASRLLLAALTRLPAFVVYPCYSVGAILVISLCSVLLFHERLSRRQWGAVGMILAAVALLNL